MKTLILGLCLMASNALAGGIGFEDTYTGVHPLTGRTITVEVESNHSVGQQGTVTIKEIGTLKKDLKLIFVSRDSLETVFDLIEVNDEGEKSVAKIVTSGDCQMVENAYLKFNSGIMILIQPKQDEE